MIDFNSDICHFCNQYLFKTNNGSTRCLNDECRSYYENIRFLKSYGRISYSIEEYRFSYYFDDSRNPSGMTVDIIDESGGKALAATQHLIADTDNYLQVVDRLRKLQVFT